MSGPFAQDPRSTSPGRSPCEVFSEAASLRVDRELGHAEEAALEAHLKVCAACRARESQAEAVSRVLKHWDAERARHVRAPARLRLEVRAAVAESAGRRRRERRVSRGLHLATAASVLLVLGAALALGLGRARDRVASRPTFADRDGAREAPASTVVGEVTLARLAPVRLSALPVTALGAPAVPEVAWLARGELDGLRDDLVRYQVLNLEQQDFLRGSEGEPGVWWTDRFGRARLITLGALALLQSYGAGNPEGYFEELAASSGERRLPGGHIYGDHTTSLDTGRRVADVLPLPTGRSALDRWLARKTHRVGIGLDAHLLTRSDVPGRVQLPGRVYDLKRAVEAGRLSMHEVSTRDARRDDLVAMVKGSGYPVFVPAGELIGGGRVDRVVTEDVWIPAGSDETPYTISCLAVSSEGGARGTTPAPTGLVAGPSVRLALARQADGEALLVLVDDLLRAAGMEITAEFSLLQLHDGPGLLRQARGWAQVLLNNDALGVLVTDADGGIVGFDVSDLPREAAADVLGKIMVGHGVEAAIQARRAAAAGALEEPSEREHALVALLNLFGYENSFRAPASEKGRSYRRAGVGDPRSRIVFTILEHVSSGRLVLGSAYVRGS